MRFRKMLAIMAGGLLALGGCGSKPAETAADITTAGAALTESADDTEGKMPAKGFYVDGTRLLDANGNEFVMRGINHAHTWFKDKLDISLEAIAKTGANCVRIVLANGDQWQKDSRESIDEIIEKCREMKLVTVLEVHDGTGKDEAARLESIADYWIEMKDALIGNEKYVILNIANEWYGSRKSGSWAKVYCSVIPRLREAGIENLIMVDAAGWGQYGKSVAEKGAEVFASDPLGNTMFSIHMYGSAGGTRSKIKGNIDGALSKGLCLCIGEFGYLHSDGDVDEAFIMEYCNEKSVGYLGWSWKGNSGGVKYLDIAKTWDGSELSSDWGEPLINGANGIRETSRICSVFDE